jgi:hypothetical protein
MADLTDAPGPIFGQIVDAERRVARAEHDWETAAADRRGFIAMDTDNGRMTSTRHGAQHVEYLDKLERAAYDRLAYARAELNALLRELDSWRF